MKLWKYQKNKALVFRSLSLVELTNLGHAYLSTKIEVHHSDMSQFYVFL